MNANQVEMQANALLGQYGIVAAPVDVEALANGLGIRVERADLGDDVSGILVRNGDKAVVAVNWAHHPNRQRFTVAHELGHFMLHAAGTYIDKGTYARFRDEQSGSGTDRQEVEANAFAAALLMPAELLRQEAGKHPFDPADDRFLSSLASTFGVSVQALSFRLANLGLLAAPKVR